MSQLEQFFFLDNKQRSVSTKMFLLARRGEAEGERKVKRNKELTIRDKLITKCVAKRIPPRWCQRLHCAWTCAECQRQIIINPQGRPPLCRGRDGASAKPELLTFFTHQASVVGSGRCKMGHSKPWGNRESKRERGRGRERASAQGGAGCRKGGMGVGHRSGRERWGMEVLSGRSLFLLAFFGEHSEAEELLDESEKTPQWEKFPLSCLFAYLLFTLSAFVRWEMCSALFLCWRQRCLLELDHSAKHS